MTNKLLLLLGLLLVPSTTTSTLSTKPHPQHQKNFTPAKKRTPPKITLVLGGGGIKGMAHVGVLEVLHNAGITPDLIVGCSIGSIIGALYADKKDIQHLKQVSFALAPFTHSYQLLSTPSLYKGIIKGNGVFHMHNINKKLTSILQARTFDDLHIPLAVVATNLRHATLTTFTHGPLIPTLCASSAIPGLFQPVQIAGEYYADGYILSQIPVRAAREQGAKLIIAVNICNKPKLPKKLKSFNVIRHSLNILVNRLAKQDCQHADIIIDPNLVGESNLFTNAQGVQRLYEAGKKAAQQALPTIQQAIKKLN